MDINEEIINALKPDKERFINQISDKEKFIYQIPDNDDNFLIMYYLQIILMHNGIKYFVNLLKKSNINEKLINKFTDDLLKLNIKIL